MRLLPKRFHSEKAYATFENELASASTIGTSADADLEWALHMAQKAVKGQPAGAWNYTALGLVHYRRGQYEQAIVQLEQSLKVDGSWIAGGHTYPVLAMAYHRLGRKEKAREALEKTERLIDQWSNDFLRVPAWSTAMPWFNWMACYLLYREAETLINGVAPVDDPRMYVARARSFAALKNQTKVDEACAKAVESAQERSGSAGMRAPLQRFRAMGESGCQPLRDPRPRFR